MRNHHTRSQLLEMAQREEFTSKYGGTISLGRYKNRQTMPRNQDCLLNHTSVVDRTLPAAFHGGLTETKFGKGFSRRQKDQISNPLAESEVNKIEAYQRFKSERTSKTGEVRARTLDQKNNPSGYNIISGQVIDPARTSQSSKSQGLKCFEQVLGEEAPNRGKSILRESQGRYFAPFPSGKNQEFRQEVLYNEGLLNPRRTGILDPHKKDLHSYGVEDQFSKSQYMKTTPVTQTGLHESRDPGRFTPRKIPNHPSGNDGIVRSWNTNIDLNNRTLQGIL